MYADSEADAVAWMEAISTAIAAFAALAAALESLDTATDAHVLRAFAGVAGTGTATDSLLGPGPAS
jgi:hypothetical protein